MGSRASSATVADQNLRELLHRLRPPSDIMDASATAPKYMALVHDRITASEKLGFSHDISSHTPGAELSDMNRNGKRKSLFLDVFDFLQANITR